MATIEEMIPQYEKYYGTLVLIDSMEFYSVVLLKEIRLIQDDGFGGDYYYIVINFKGEEQHISCVGWMIPLSDKIDKDAYNAMIHQWNYNFKIRYEGTIAK